MKSIEKLGLLCDEINKVHHLSYLNKIVCLTQYDYLFEFSRNKKENILVSMNVKNPFLKVTDKKFNSNETNPFHIKLKSKLLNACFIEAKIINKDNIVSFEFIKTTDTYDKIHYFLVFEIFKSNSNLILLIEDKVNEAFRFKSLDTNHPIIKNATYLPPLKQDFEPEVKEKDVINENLYFENIDKLRLQNKYKEIQTNLKRKQKSLLRKIDNINADREKAIANLEYKDIADAMLADLSSLSKGDSTYNYYGRDIPLKETFSPTDNIQRFYKIYKKSKLTIASTEEQLRATKDEIDYIDSLLSTLDLYNEDDYSALIKELSDRNIIKIPGKFKQKNIKNAAEPYYFVRNGIKFGFGKNAIQNTNLTFNYASKNDYFLHIKNDHGNHVIIFANDLDDDTLEFGVELTLYLSGKKDGEVIVANCKTIKKGSVPGLVLLSNYESYFIKEFKYDFEKYVSNAKRF